jgi:hypothetical protein
VYSFADWRELRVQYPAPSTRLIAVVALEGITIEGRKGYRSQAARVTDIWLRPGHLRLPEEVTTLLRVHYPDVRFHTDLTGMIAAHPELPNSQHPRRELLARAGRQWKLTVRRRSDGWLMPAATAAGGTVLAFALSWVVFTTDYPGLGGQLVMLASAVLALLAFVLVSSELLLQLATVAVMGVSQSLLFAPHRPTMALGVFGLPAAAAGSAAAAVRGSPQALWVGLVFVVAWLLMMAAELFMTLVAPGRRAAPWRTFAAGARPVVESRPQDGNFGRRRRRPRRGVWPVVIIPSTEGE